MQLDTGIENSDISVDLGLPVVNTEEDLNVMRQTACLVVDPIKVNSFAYLFNCTTVGRTSD